MNIITCKAAREAGLTRYFTGKPCPKGHLSERHVAGRACIACVRAATEVWIEANIDRRRASKKACREKNADIARVQKRVWNAANPDKVKAHKDTDYARHKAEIRVKNDAWLTAHPGAARLANKAWSARNPEKVRANGAKQRNWRKLAEGDYTADELKALFATQGGICNGCCTPLGAGYHVDHVMPLKLGGTNRIENIQLLCAPCNFSKGAKHPDVWRARKAA